MTRFSRGPANRQPKHLPPCRCPRILLRTAVLMALFLAPERASADFLVQTFEANSQVYSVNPDTGASAFLGRAGVELTDLAFAPDGRLFGVSLADLFSLNPATGAATLIGSFATTTSTMVGLTFGPAGLLYGVDQSGGLYTIDPASGHATLQFFTPFTYVGDVASSSGGLFYATALGSGGSHLIQINSGTHSASDLGLIASGQSIPGIDFDQTGRLIAFAVSGNVYAIPNFSSSGTGVFLSDTGVAAAGATDIPEAPSAVPEPSSATLIVLGAVGVLWASRKRRLAAN